MELVVGRTYKTRGGKVVILAGTVPPGFGEGGIQYSFVVVPKALKHGLGNCPYYVTSDGCYGRTQSQNDLIEEWKEPAREELDLYLVRGTANGSEPFITTRQKGQPHYISEQHFTILGKKTVEVSEGEGM